MKAKDRATGREQQVRITASSMLSKDDVDQMVRDAQEHAEEDRKRRDEVETRNQADALAFQAERTLRDLGDKVSSEDKADVENKVASAARGPQGQRPRRRQGTASELAEALQRVGTAAYQARPRRAERRRGYRREQRQRPARATGEGAPEAEEAVEGEFKEV